MLTQDGAVLCWHRGLRTTGFNGSAPESKRLELMVEKLLALLISASRGTDSRAGTETNHLRLEKSLRMERLSQLIGGEKGLISVGSAVSRYVSPSMCVFGCSGFPED